MPRPEDPRPRWRRPLVYTAAVLVLAGAGATTVFLVGSSNRRSDKAALVAYEEAILPPIREAGRIVQQEMKPTLRELAEGTITDDQLLRRTPGWARVFERSRQQLLALDPPALLGDIENGWNTAMGGYLLAVDAFEAIAGQTGSVRAARIESATTFGERADGFFDSVAGVIQFHRRRLGLGRSANLPDPTPTASG